MRAIHGTLRPFDAAPHAGRALGAGVERAIGAGGDGVGRRPPVPAQPVVSPRHSAAHGRQGTGRQRRTLARWEGRIPGQPRHPEVRFHPFVVRHEVFVSQRPVICHSVE